MNSIFKKTQINEFVAVDSRFLLLVGLLVFLPGVEALKNIFAFLFVLFWVINANRKNDWGGKWQSIDTIFLLWILADIIISVNAVINHELSGRNFRDVIRFVLIAWVLSRTSFPKVNLSKLASFAVISTIVTLIYSYFSTGGVLKELHSVGHINHTAIFLVIAYSISLSLLLFNFKNMSNFLKVVILISTVILFTATIDTDSRATFGLIVIVTIMQFIYLLIRVRKLTMFFLFFGLISSIGIIFIQNPPQALNRILEKDHILQDDARDKIRNFSFYAFKKNPLLGTGFGNYSEIKIDDLKPLIIEDMGIYDSELYLHSSHAHNVYYTYLVSGGILIFSIFLWFWFYIFWIIIKLLPSKQNEWIVMSSLSVVLINLGIGWVNTTLHHEHAILSMFILGLLISQYRQVIKQSYPKEIS